MLGVNQVIMMALSMLVVSSFVGTNDLGKQIQVAISQADPGRASPPASPSPFSASSPTADRPLVANRRARLG